MCLRVDGGPPELQRGYIVCSMRESKIIAKQWGTMGHKVPPPPPLQSPPPCKVPPPPGTPSLPCFSS